MGVEQLKLPTPDFVASPSQEFINQGVSFILKHRQQQHSVYVHCKAGRTRSATIVACYLMKVSLVILTTNKSKWLKYILLFKNLHLPYMYILLTHYVFEFKLVNKLIFWTIKGRPSLCISSAQIGFLFVVNW